MSLYTGLIRPGARQVLSRCLPRPPRRARRVAVLGLPRSGTSWVAKTLSLGRSVTYYFEPDEVLGPEYRYRYLAPGAEDPRLAAFVERTFTGGVHHEYVTAEQGLGDFLARASAQTVLVKWVKHVLAAEWLLEAQPELHLVQVIRHPVPLALSWKARGWAMDRDLEVVLAQEELLDTVLSEQRDVMTRARTYWEKVGCLWGAATLMQLRAHRRFPGRSLLSEHEWYCEAPEARFGRLFDALGLEPTPAVKAFLSPSRGRASGPGYGQARDSKTEIHKWHGQLDKAELRQLASTVEAFELPFYPGLAPDVFWEETQA